MLQLRPNCECCNRDLPPAALDARICSFECTFCEDCSRHMQFICPNCSGNLVLRPTRTRSPVNVAVSQVTKKILG